MMPSRLHSVFCVVMGLLVSAGSLPGQSLDQTTALPPGEDWSLRMQDGAHRFIERMIAQAPSRRAERWRLDTTSAQALVASAAEPRRRLGTMLGLLDERTRPVVMERFGDDDNPALAGTFTGGSIWQVRWTVLPGFHAEGLLLEPVAPPKGHLILLPDAAESPEFYAGLGIDSPRAQAVRRWVASGLQVLIPTLLDRDRRWSGRPQLAARHPAVPATVDQSHREWIWRQAFHMGRHPAGFEVQEVMAGIDWINQRFGADAPVAVAGYGEGGAIALYAAAFDPRISASLISGYFNDRQALWSEPIDRNVWGLLRDFGDAELISLAAPRPMVIEHSAFPEVSGEKGSISTPPAADVRAEFDRIRALLPVGLQTRTLLTGPAGGPVTEPLSHSLDTLMAHLGLNLSVPEGDISPPVHHRTSFDASARMGRLVRALETIIQQRVRESDLDRDHHFLGALIPERLRSSRAGGLSRTHRVDPLPVAPFIEGSRKFRQQFRRDIVGEFDEPRQPLRPRSRVAYDQSPRWVGHEVVIDVFPECSAWGFLLVPRDLQPGERRPVVVCQHGLENVPAETIEPGKWVGASDFAARLADRGFITFAPHNLYRHGERFRQLHRKANTIGASLYSLITAQHEQWLTWLSSRPEVDAGRIGFYGISYGGTTAMFVPPAVEGYALSICCANFNQWTRMVAGTEAMSYMFTGQWEFPHFNMGGTFSHAELAFLMVPRPFMVERGQHDSVALSSEVASEFAKVQWLYDQFGLGDRTTLEVFSGGHCINGEGTFDFLHRHLNWPAPPQQ